MRTLSPPTPAALRWRLPGATRSVSASATSSFGAATGSRRCKGECFDLIASNPPYIADGDSHLGEGDLRFEPASALSSGADGLDAIRTIVSQAAAHLHDGGWLLLEHGWDQGDAVRALLTEADFRDVFTARDLEDRDRASLGRRGQDGPRVRLSAYEIRKGVHMRPLYPDITPYQTGTLQVDDRHSPLLGTVRQSRRQAGGDAAWRSRRRMRPENAAFP